MIGVKTTDYSQLERAALMTLWLRSGARLTVNSVARRFGVSYNQAKYDLIGLSRVLPIVRDDSETPGVWRWMAESWYNDRSERG